MFTAYTEDIGSDTHWNIVLFQIAALGPQPPFGVELVCVVSEEFLAAVYYPRIDAEDGLCI